MPEPAASLASLLQEFLEARISAEELFRRAAAQLPPGSDPSVEVLTWLAESDQLLRLPRDRRALAQRLREFAREEIFWEKLDLWAFAVEHTEEFSLERPAETPEAALLRAVLGWIEDWQEVEARPAAAKLEKLADLLLAESDPARCLAKLEEALEQS